MCVAWWSGRCVSYVSGALVSVLLMLALVDESVLLYIPLGDKNLLWYTAIFSAALAVSRSLIPEPEDAMFDPEGAMRVVRERVHRFAHAPTWVCVGVRWCV